MVLPNSGGGLQSAAVINIVWGRARESIIVLFDSWYYTAPIIIGLIFDGTFCRRACAITIHKILIARQPVARSTDAQFHYMHYAHTSCRTRSFTSVVIVVVHRRAAGRRSAYARHAYFFLRSAFVSVSKTAYVSAGTRSFSLRLSKSSRVVRGISVIRRDALLFFFISQLFSPHRACVTDPSASIYPVCGARP